MGVYVRTSRGTGVGMPFLVAAFVLPLYWSLVACIWMLKLLFQLGILLNVVVLKLLASGVKDIERRRSSDQGGNAER